VDKRNVILVTGATGRQGGAVARELLGKGYTVRAMTRKPEGAPASELRRLGAEVVPGNFDDPASLDQALRGAWGVFSVQNTWEAGVEGEERQGKQLAESARKAGVQHLVYTSVGSAHRKTGIPHFENKQRIEEKVRSLGFPSYTILRPVFFMENWTLPWFLPAIQQGSVAIGIAPDTVLQMIAVADIGKYGLWAFERHADLNGRAIDIAGDARTMPETAEIIGRAMGRKLQHVRVPIAEVRKFSEDFAIMLEWFDRVGYDADIAKMSKESGIRPVPLGEWAEAVNWTPTGAAI
jgi:uncharacterized protein YbjT (DUF2867 family)